MNMDFREVKVDPEALRFSQDSIAAYLRSPCGENVPLRENLEKLKSGELHPDEFPQLEVSKDEDGVLWSNDNRRLWLFRTAGISQITVKLFSIPLFRAPPKSEGDRALMCTPYFIPRIRRQRQRRSAISTQPIDNYTENMLTGGVIKLNPNAVRFSEKSIAPYWTAPSGKNLPLEKILELLKSGNLSPDDLRRLEVSRDKDGVLWANDNEKLWLFRKAGISQITVNLSTKPLFRGAPISEGDRARMSSPDFFPSIRGQSQETASPSTHLKPDDRDTVVKLNPNTIRFSEKSIAPYWTAPSGKNLLLEKILEILKSVQLSPDDFPALEVSRDKDGVLWANDNERLWLLRKAGISQITVKLSTKPLFRASEDDRALMSTRDFFPSIRGQSQKAASISTQLMDNDTGALLTGAKLKENPNAASVSQNSFAECSTTPRIDRNEYLLPKSEFSARIGGQPQETASTSTSTQITGDDIVGFLVGLAGTASALYLGFAGWKLSALVMGFTGWKLFKK